MQNRRSVRGIHAERSLEDARDALSDAGYRARSWVKTNDDAMGTVTERGGKLLARLYVTKDDADVGYVQLRHDMTYDFDAVDESHADEVREVLE